jgi:hypothetical protein
MLFEKPVTPLLRQLQVSSLLEKGWEGAEELFQHLYNADFSGKSIPGSIRKRQIAQDKIVDKTIAPGFL